MTQLHSLINTVVASAMNRTADGAGKGDIAYGLLAGLKRLRTVVSVQGGYTAACGLDDRIHELFVERSLEAFGAQGSVTPVPLPPRRPQARRACLIFEDVAMSCLTLNAYFPGNTALELAVRAMAERLVEVLGGVPDWGEVVDEMRIREADAEDAVGDGRWTSVAVH